MKVHCRFDYSQLDPACSLAVQAAPMEFRTVGPFYCLILIDDEDLPGHWLVVLCSRLHRCLHKFWVFFFVVVWRRVDAPNHHACCSDYAIWVFLTFMRVIFPLDPDPIDCVNGLVRAVWRVASCIYVLIPGILNPFIDENYLYPPLHPFHGISHLEYHVCQGILNSSRI